MLRGDYGYRTPPTNTGRSQGAALVTTRLASGTIGLCVLLPGGAGTERTRETAERLGIDVIDVAMVYPSGPRVVNAMHSPPSPRTFYIGPPGAAQGRDQQLTIPAELFGGPAGSQEQPLRRWMWSKINPEASTFDPQVIAALDQLRPDSEVSCVCVDSRGYGWCHGYTVLAAWNKLRHG